MPTYDYGCEACGKTWELEQRITEDPIKKCPKCGKMKAKRLITGGNFILKGSGWYADLYHKPKGGSKAGSSNADSGSSDAGSSADSSSSSDSKPEKKEKKASKKKEKASS